MTYPIKYIDNNLVWNQFGEVFAYYEFTPYNYSCISSDSKHQIYDNFRQMIAQNKGDQIHALQVGSQSSIRAMQKRCKKHVTGELTELAYDRIEQQTEVLIQNVGEVQVDYRFFIGFKLALQEREVSLSSMKKKLGCMASTFVREVNHRFMNDFVIIPTDELNRYVEAEELLVDKLSRRFKIRKVEPDDYGYILEHLYGKVKELPYEDYEYHLPVKKYKGIKMVKSYDLIKPIRTLMKEHKRHVELIGEHGTTCAAYFTIETITSELDFPNSEISYYLQEQFAFPVDVSIHVEAVENRKALTTLRNKKKELKDLDQHAYQNDKETEEVVEKALDDVSELEGDLTQNKEPMYKVSYIVRVCAENEKELERRCDEVKDFYDDYNLKLVRPFGNMTGLHEEFIPSSRRLIKDYIQYVESDFLAGMGFGATQILGEREGIYIGYNVATGWNVYLNPALACQGVKGSVTNALAVAIIGSLGGGKSFLNNLIMYYALLYGAKEIILDPKGERGNWIRELPELQPVTNVINLTAKEENRGLLDPYVIMKSEKDAESLALDILTFLTGITSRDAKKFPVLRRAVKQVTKSEKKGMLHVIEQLRDENTDLSNDLAEHIESVSDYGFSCLLFSDGNVKNHLSFEKQLNIIQVEDLMLPDAQTEFKDYTMMELLSVAMLITISTFSLDFIHSDRSAFKIVDLDEAWSILQVAQGKALSMKLVRAGRAMNAGVYFVTQNSDDLLDEKMKNNIGLKFAFRSTDCGEIQKTLQLFGLDPQEEANQKLLSNLENGQCLFQDLYGQIGVIQIDPVFQDIFQAFDTRPPMQREE